MNDDFGWASVSSLGARWCLPVDLYHINLWVLWVYRHDALHNPNPGVMPFQHH
jgi:hypothetical protein